MLNNFVNRSSSPPCLLFSRAFFSSTLFVKGISFSSTEETLTQAFSQFGRVLGVDVIMDKVRCRPKGFAYVTFSSNEEASKALLELNGPLVDGRVVTLDTAKAVKHNQPGLYKPKHAVEGVTNSQTKAIPESLARRSVTFYIARLSEEE